jgi:hypothetical protein
VRAKELPQAAQTAASIGTTARQVMPQAAQTAVSIGTTARQVMPQHR